MVGGWGWWAGARYRCEPIGVMRCGFDKEFGMPRQQGLVAEAAALLGRYRLTAVRHA